MLPPSVSFNNSVHKTPTYKTSPEVVTLNKILFCYCTKIESNHRNSFPFDNNGPVFLVPPMYFPLNSMTTIARLIEANELVKTIKGTSNAEHKVTTCQARLIFHWTLACLHTHQNIISVLTHAIIFIVLH